MKLLLFIVFILLNRLVFAQQISIKFNPVFGLIPIALNKNYSYRNDSVQITSFKFYVSDIKFYANQKLIPVAIKKYHLVDIANLPSLILQGNFKNRGAFNRIQLSIGTDSLTNVSGIHTNDLDPVNGMYWTWHSGYINFKLEGKSKICPSRNNEFIFHIGGYQSNNSTIQHLAFTITPQKKIIINVDVEKLFSQLNLNECYHLMSPGLKAVEMANKVSGIFKVSK